MMKLSECCEQLNCSKPVLVKAIDRGELKAYKLQRDYRVKEEDWSAYIASLEVVPEQSTEVEEE